MFKPVSQCCVENCFKDVEIHDQEVSFKYFWSFGDYQSQNVYLSGLMKKKSSTTPNEERNVTLWEYSFSNLTSNFSVCRKFLCNIFQIDKSRFGVIQKKLANNETLNDQRGKHDNHTVKLTDDIKILIERHCESIPNSESHYRREHSNLKYFDNSDLNLEKLYMLFLDYYYAETGDEDPPITKTTYFTYFNHHVNFSFVKPKTDVCDYCFENENNEHQDESFIQHIKDKDNYLKLKHEMLREENVLCCEFDFAQNLPMPKLPVSDQFYKRLLWLYVFNVHIYGSNKRSYMFPCIEGFYKKGSNLVCNYLLNAISEELKLDHYGKIYLFSDACGGQNRNYNVLTFLSLLSNHFQVEVHHVYPIRGHSYCQCDRNFGVYGQKKKRIEKFETADEYIEMIKTSRDPPFIIVNQDEIEIKDFESMLNATIPNELQISKLFKIVYFPNGHVNAFEKYDMNPVDYYIDCPVSLDSLIRNSIVTSPVGITAAKIEDVKSLLKYLSPVGKQFYDDIFKILGKKETGGEKKTKKKEPNLRKKKEKEKKQIEKKKQAEKKKPEKMKHVEKESTKKKQLEKKKPEKMKQVEKKPAKKKQPVKKLPGRKKQTGKEKKTTNKKVN